MKYPNHLILDVFSAKFNLISNWNINYQLTKINNSLLNEFDVLVKFTKNIYSKQNFKNEKTIKNDNLWSIFDIFFLKKEKIYTKLKYSRTPQYDIVSGGVAAIFSGFLGFLICEKFGFELLDSGDFYFLFMYAVFFFFLVDYF